MTHIEGHIEQLSRLIFEFDDSISTFLLQCSEDGFKCVLARRETSYYYHSVQKLILMSVKFNEK